MCTTCRLSFTLFSVSTASRMSFECPICGPVFWRKPNDPPDPPKPPPRERHFWSDTPWSEIVFYVGLAAVICTAIICSSTNK